MASTVVDIHSHMLPADCIAELQRLDRRFAPTITRDPASGLEWGEANGRRFGPFGRGMYDADARMRDHRDRRIDVQAISIPPWLLSYDADAALASAFARVLNDAITEVVRAFPDRAVGMATVPLQDPKAAVRELERAVDTQGMRGVLIGTNVNGRNLDDEALEPFWATAARLGVVVFIHPASVLSTDRLRRYYLTNLIGNPLDTTIAVASLIFGGVLDRHPGLILCFAHGGGFAPYQQGRFDQGWRKRAESRQRIQRPPSEYLGGMHFDSILHRPEAVAFLVRTVGPQRVLLGSDYPFDMGPDDPRGSVEAVADLSDEERRAILGENASALLRLG